jgi:hypothetical protein
VPPELTSRPTVPPGTDYVCVKCGRLHRWTNGKPSRLTVLGETDIQEDDDGLAWFVD